MNIRYIIVVIFKDGRDRPGTEYRLTKRGWETDCNGGTTYYDVNIAFRERATYSAMFPDVEYVVEER